MLDVERVDALNELGFVWDPHLEAWIRGFDALKAFVDENGHARVTAKFVTSDGIALGTWVGTLRKAT